MTSVNQHQEKPALPPKPQWTKYIRVEDEQNDPTSTEIETRNPKIAATFPSRTSFHSDTAVEMDQECLPVKYIQEAECLPQPTEESSLCQINGVQRERNVIQKINAAEEIQMCMKKYADEGKHDTNLSLKEALQNFERKDPKKGQVLCKKVKVTDPRIEDRFLQDNSPLDHITYQTPLTVCNERQNQPCEKPKAQMGKVVLREKKPRETEDQRRQRLSVHMDEIVKGNVKVAMEIFDNLRKRDELQGVLAQVHEIEGDRRSMNEKSLKKLYNNYPVWASTETNTKQGTMEEKLEMESLDDDQESISSVDTAYEDLEKASKEILLLKEQTIAKLLNIEETIKKALYSVSNLKSEADIAGLSGLFDESLKSEQNLHPTNNIRKISIGSCKSKAVPNRQTGSSKNGLKEESPRHVQQKLSPSQSSPSFISIHSAARKPVEQPKPTMTTFAPKSDTYSHCCHKANSDVSKNTPQRKVSVLEVKTAPGQPPAGLVGTKTVSETYEETDGFGNVFMSSSTSTFVHKQAESQHSALFEVVPARCEVVSSPLMQRRHFEEQVLNKSKGERSVFVTFSPPMDKH